MAACRTCGPAPARACSWHAGVRTSPLRENTAFRAAIDEGRLAASHCRGLRRSSPDRLHARLPPLSIVSARGAVRALTIAPALQPGMFVTGSTAYTRRGVVTSNRPFYFTNPVLHDESRDAGRVRLRGGGVYRKRVRRPRFPSRNRGRREGAIFAVRICRSSPPDELSRAGAMVMVPTPGLRDLSFRSRSLHD